MVIAFESNETGHTDRRIHDMRLSSEDYDIDVYFPRCVDLGILIINLP